MLVKVAILFLAFMALIGWIGRWLVRLRPPKAPPRLGAARCPACGRPRIGRDACPCGGAA